MLGLAISDLRIPRTLAGNRSRVATRVLVVTRDEMTGARTRAVNALTALVRTIDLGIDARTSLSAAQIAAIAGWRTRVEDTNTRICRHEAVRLDQRIRTLDGEIASNRATVTKLIAQDTPQLLELSGVGAIVAASVLVAWSHPGRVRCEAAMASLAGTCPIPASSGNTVRHRLNRSGDRRLNRAHDHRDRSHENGSRDPRLRRPPSCRGSHDQGNHALLEALHHASTVPHLGRGTPDSRDLTNIEASWVSRRLGGKPRPNHLAHAVHVASAHGVVERLKYELGAHVVRHCPAEHPTRAGVADGAQVGLAGADGHVGDIARPLAIQLGGDEDSIDEVDRVVGVTVRDGRDLERARTDPCDPQCANARSDRVLTDRFAPASCNSLVTRGDP